MEKELLITLLNAIMMVSLLLAYSRSNAKAATCYVPLKEVNNLFTIFVVGLVDIVIIVFTLNITTWWSLTITTYIVEIEHWLFVREFLQKAKDQIIKTSQKGRAMLDLLSLGINLVILLICILIQQLDGWNWYHQGLTLTPLAIFAFAYVLRCISKWLKKI